MDNYNEYNDDDTKAESYSSCYDFFDIFNQSLTEDIHYKSKEDLYSKKLRMSIPDTFILVNGDVIN